MSREGNAAPKSHATAWTLAIVAVPVLYVLTFPVVWALTPRMSGPLPLRHIVRAKPKWLELYAAPYYWLASTSLLGEPLSSYNLWVWQRLGGY